MCSKSCSAGRIALLAGAVGLAKRMNSATVALRRHITSFYHPIETACGATSASVKANREDTLLTHSRTDLLKRPAPPSPHPSSPPRLRQAWPPGRARDHPIRGARRHGRRIYSPSRKCGPAIRDRQSRRRRHIRGGGPKPSTATPFLTRPLLRKPSLSEISFIIQGFPAVFLASLCQHPVVNKTFREDRCT